MCGLEFHQKHNKKAIDEFTGMKRPKEPFLKPKTTRKQIKNIRTRGLTDEQVKYITGLTKLARDALRKAIANCKYKPIMMRQKTKNLSSKNNYSTSFYASYLSKIVYLFLLQQ